METNFEKSNIYKNALKEYQEKIYGEILKPLHVIVVNEDIVYLFYNLSIINDIFAQIKDIYYKQYNDEDTDFPIHLGCEDPRLSEVTFMGNKYKSIVLWYDHSDLPNQFEAKI